MTDIELTHLRYFIALAEELHYARAAERLHIAQPPLTRQIKLLEERLQCRLFDRNTRATRLTAAGEQLLPKARTLVAEAEHTFEGIRRIGSGEEGQLTVATAPSLMLGALPRAIRMFRKKAPRVDFRLQESASSEIVKAVRNNTADLGLIRGGDSDAEVQTHLEWQEPMVAILPVDHALANEKKIALSALRDEPFVLFPRHIGPAFYEEVTGACRQAGFEPQIAQEARQWSSIVSLVSVGMGVSVGPKSIAGLLPKGTCYPRIKGFATTVRLVGRPNASNPALAKFLAILRAEIQ